MVVQLVQNWRYCYRMPLVRLETILQSQCRHIKWIMEVSLSTFWPSIGGIMWLILILSQIIRLELILVELVLVELVIVELVWVGLNELILIELILIELVQSVLNRLALIILVELVCILIMSLFLKELALRWTLMTRTKISQMLTITRKVAVSKVALRRPWFKSWVRGSFWHRRNKRLPAIVWLIELVMMHRLI